MSSVCGGCSKLIEDDYYMTCSQCKNKYDLICILVPKDKYFSLTQTQKDNWLCPSCVSSRPKGDNTSTPLRSSTTPASLNSSFTCNNVNMSRGSRPTAGKSKNNKDDAQPNHDMSAIITELRQLRQEIIDVKNQNVEIKTQMSSMSDHLAHTLKEHSKIMKNAQIEIDNLKATVGNLQHQLALREQDSLKNDLEITGLNEKENENLLQIVMVTSQKIGVNLVESDIDEVVRVGRKQQRQEANINKRLMSRPIVVRLVRRGKRDELLKAAKSRRNITSENVVDGQHTPIYLNERLTKENRQLFQQARLRSKEHNFRYCWIRNGGIFVRRSDGKPAIRIATKQNLDEKVGAGKQTEDDPKAA